MKYPKAHDALYTDKRPSILDNRTDKEIAEMTGRAKDVIAIVPKNYIPHDPILAKDIKPIFKAFGLVDAPDGAAVSFPAKMAGKIWNHKESLSSTMVHHFPKLLRESVFAYTESEIARRNHTAHENIEQYKTYVNKYTVDVKGKRGKTKTETYYIRFTIKETVRGEKGGGENLAHSTFITDAELYNIEQYKEAAPSHRAKKSPGGKQTTSIDNNLAEFLSLVNKRIEVEPRVKHSLSDKSKYAPIFFSKLAQVVNTYKGEKVAATNLSSYLKARGVKDEEIKWSGIESYLEGKKSVPKEELMQFIRDNDLEATEVEYPTPTPPEARRGVYATYDDLSGAEEALVRLSEKYPGITAEEREIISPETGEVFADIRQNGGGKYEVYIINPPYFERQGTRYGSGGLAFGRNNYREVLFQLPSEETMFTHPHWEEPNVVAHTRLSDVDNGRTLFVEEVQSDWHQAGREKVYRKPLEKERGEAYYDPAAKGWRVNVDGEDVTHGFGNSVWPSKESAPRASGDNPKMGIKQGQK